MPLTDEQAEHLYAMVKDIYADMIGRQSVRAAKQERDRTAAKTARPPAGHADTASAPKPKHNPADPTVKILPKNWKGDDLRGKRFSECPPSFLGMLSHMLDAFADRAEDDGDPQKQRYAKWDRENAEGARRWRAKLSATEVVNGKPAEQTKLDEAF